MVPKSFRNLQACFKRGNQIKSFHYDLAYPIVMYNKKYDLLR